MKKYLMFLSFAFATLFTNGVIANENEEKTEPKKEMSIDVKAPAALIDGQVVTIGEVKEIYDNNQTLQAYPFELVYPRLAEEVVKAKIIKITALKAGADKLPEVQKAVKEQAENIAATFYLINEIKKQETEENLMKAYKEYFKPENEANEIIKKLKKGADFAKLANEVSLDKSSDGGDIGYFKKYELGKELQPFADAAFEIKKGEISKKPVKSFMGYHVIKVEDIKTIEPPAYEEVKNEVIAIFEKHESEKLVNNLIKNANPKFYPLTPEKDAEKTKK